MHYSSGKPSGRKRFHEGPRPENRQYDQQRRVNPHQVASALSVAGSAENLALALDMTVPRVNQLAEGVEFSAETAYHIELVLDVPGFLDQVNPTISSALKQRLQEPLEVESKPNLEQPLSSTTVESPADAAPAPKSQEHPMTTAENFNEGQPQQEQPAPAADTPVSVSKVSSTATAAESAASQTQPVDSTKRKRARRIKVPRTSCC